MIRVLILALTLTACAPLPVRDPYADAIRRENSLRLLEIGAQLMKSSQPRPLVPYPIYAPQTQSCVEFGYGYTSCRQW